MPEVSVSTSIAVLTQIWQRVLQVPAVGIEDNFFDLGGDSALAVQLFAEIARVCGRQLPPVMIYHVPTIAEQAAILEQPTPPQLSPLVRLKAGVEKAPLFIAPGLGGGPAEFFHLVKHLHSFRAIYGMQPQGFDGLEAPHDNIGDMSEFFLQAVRQIQPHGPYFLVGYSLGGLVALEMARSLRSGGEQIALLVMLDSYPHISHLPTTQRVRLLGLRARFRVTNVLHGQETRHAGRSMDAAEVAAFAPAMEQVKDCAYAALRRYRPAFYPGEVRFVRAEAVSSFPEDPSVVWSHLVARLTVETVPGDHLAMLTTHYQHLGSVLTRYVQEATLQTESKES